MTFDEAFAWTIGAMIGTAVLALVGLGIYGAVQEIRAGRDPFEGMTGEGALLIFGLLFLAAAAVIAGIVWLVANSGLFG